MKKSLIVTLALVFVLSIAGTAFAAANPFVDVPAKHWAYSAVAQLAKAGIVDGYGDGTFRGDNTMTRYEMAQIVAKAMAKSDKANAENKALIDKLAVEFNTELQNLGVRVAKLEKQVGTIKVSGDARLRWVVNNAVAGHDSKFAERFRVNMAADVNENTSFYGRFIGLNHNEMGATGTDDKAFVSDAALTTKNIFNTGVTATLGRFSHAMGQTKYLADTTGCVDGGKVMFGNVVKVTAGFANFAPAAADVAADLAKDKQAVAGVKDAVFAEIVYPTSKAVTVGFDYFKETNGNKDYDIKGLGLTYKVNSDWVVRGDYMKNTAVANDPKAWVAQVSYKGANKAVPQSWGVAVAYKKFEAGAAPTQLSTAAEPIANEKAYLLSASYTLAKNIVFEGYQTFNRKDATTDAEKANFTRLQVNYFF